MKIMLETINGNEIANDVTDDKDNVALIEKFIKKYHKKNFFYLVFH